MGKERTKNERDGEEIIERTAKKLILEGMHYVTRESAAFIYIFGREEFDKLEKYAFEYIHRKFELLNKKQYPRNHFNEQVWSQINNLCTICLHVYHKGGRGDIKNYTISYPSGKELDAVIMDEIMKERGKK